MMRSAFIAYGLMLRMAMTFARRVPLRVLIALTPLAGCRKKKPPQAVDFSRELPPGRVALRKITPAEYPDFSKCTWNLSLLSQATAHSIDWLGHPSSRASFPYLDISHQRAQATANAFKA